MNISPIRYEPYAVDIQCTEEDIIISIADGRKICVPLIWFPRLFKATPEQQADWRLIGRGIGIHWESIDEDISVESLLSVQ